MEIYQIIILSIVQGITEFLPVSSSAHLILTPKLLDWQDQGLVMDVAVHVGTLLAVMLFFKEDIKSLIVDFFKSIHQKQEVGESKLAWMIIVGTIPVGLAGLLLGGFIEEFLRSPIVIATTTIVFGVVLFLSEKFTSKKEIKNIGLKDAILIGISQALALIPGTSRSGVTMSMAMLLGYSKEVAAKFSFLLSIPVIILAGGLKTIELLQSNLSVDWIAISIAISLSFAFAYISIKLFLDFISKIGFLPFVIYRFVLGAVLVYIFI
jgi:undecaprenyl-diphosphatase